MKTRLNFRCSVNLSQQCSSCSVQFILFFQFDKDLRRKWEQAQEDGHFRYKLDIEDTKIFGDNKYIAQVN